jgi:hypothetical protein
MTFNIVTFMKATSYSYLLVACFLIIITQSLVCDVVFIIVNKAILLSDDTLSQLYAATGENIDAV